MNLDYPATVAGSAIFFWAVSQLRSSSFEAGAFPVLALNWSKASCSDEFPFTLIPSPYFRETTEAGVWDELDEREDGLVGFFAASIRFCSKPAFWAISLSYNERPN